MPALTRIVTGTWYTASGSLDTDAPISYTLDPSSYTGDALISGGTISDTTDDEGESATTLWTNEEGYEPTRYTVTWPSGRQDTFTLPAGDDPIALNTLLTTTQLNTWQPTIIEDFIDGFRDEIYAAFASTADVALGDGLVGYRAPLTGAVARTVHSRLADDPVNVCDFGAVADDTSVSDGAMTSGQTTITSASSTFTTADIGKSFSLVGAGVSGATLDGTFTARLSATQMTASVAASTTVSGKTLSYGTENAAAMTLALTAAGANGVVYIPPGNYFLNTGIDITPVRAILGHGAKLRRSLAGNLRVMASNVHWYGVTFQFDSALDNTRRAMFESKNTTLGDTAGNHTGWRFYGCTFDGLSIAISKLNRQGNAQFSAFSNLSTSVLEGASSFSVASGTALAGASTVRIGPVTDATNPEYGNYLYPDVTSIVGNVVSVSPVVAGDLTIGQFVSQVTRLNGSHLSGATVLTVDDTALFEVGHYAQIFISQSVRVLGLITAIGASTITIATGLSQAAADNTPVAPMTDGITAGGSDFAGDVVFQDCEIKNVHNQVGLSFSGIDGATVANCHIHDIYTYLTAGDPTSGFNTSLGEAIKVSASSTRVKILGNTIERYARDGIDCYDAGELQVVGNTFRDSYIGNAMECKWLSTNINAPQPIKVVGNDIQYMYSNGLQLGGQNFLMNANLIAHCGGMGIYANGGHPDDADNQASRNYTLQGNILRHNGWKLGHTITFDTAASGTWTITTNGSTTSSLAYGATASAVQTAVRLLGGTAARASVTRTGNPGAITPTPYVYRITYTYLVTTLPAFTISTAGLSGGTAVLTSGEVSAGGSGIYVAEVIDAVISGNRVYDNAGYGIYTAEYAQYGTIVGNDFRGNNSTDILITGLEGRITGHIFSGNQYTTVSRSGIETGVVWDGMGIESGLASGASPTLATWPRLGTLVKNSTDGTLWQRDVSVFLPIGSSSEILLSAPLVWNSMDGTSGKVLSVASSPFLVDATALGVPAAAQSVIVEVAGRWTTASHSNSCTVSNGTSGGRAGLFRSMAANIGNDTQVKVKLTSGQFRITIAGADMDTAYVAVKGYVL